jgi:hypothetical protein
LTVVGCAGDVNFTVGMLDMPDMPSMPDIADAAGMAAMGEYPLMPPPHPISRVAATLDSAAPH